MQVLLSHPGVKDLYKYEDGHTLDLAAMAGHKAMVELLLKENMPVGPSAMAHAAHYNHTDIMGVRASWAADDLVEDSMVVAAAGSAFV
jgi:hypothetical protein